MAFPFRHTRAAIRSNLNSLPMRAGASAAMMTAIALVVFVLIGFLAMARGLEDTLAKTGAPDVFIVLGGGARQELGSEIAAGVTETIAAQADALSLRRDAAGAVLVSREMVMPVDAIRRETNAVQSVSLRGMDLAGAMIRPATHLTQGRMFEPGQYEIVVGDYVARSFAGFDIGEQVNIGRSTWTVVGHFAAEGTVFGSEIWAPLDAVHADFGQGQVVQTLRIGLQSPAAIRSLRPALAAIEGADLTVVSEAEFYADQSNRTARMIRFFAWPLAVMLAIGAGAGALNTMLGSITARSIEIATLRALGFSRASTFFATWAEAIVLAVLGALIGAGLGWLVFDGFSTATMGANQNQFSFALHVTSEVVRPAVILAVLIGLFGGLIPAWIGSRNKLVTALRLRG